LVAAVISALIMMVAWRRRKVISSARPMTVFGFAITWWCLTYAIHWSNFYRPSEYFWLDITYLGALLVPASFLAFVLCYTGRCDRLNRISILLLSIEPLFVNFFLWTDSHFGFFFGGERQAGSDAILLGGFLFWFNVFYSYLLILIAFILLSRFFLKTSRSERAQTGIILVGAVLPWITNIVSIFGLSPFPNLDLTPFSFVLTGIAFTFGIFRFGFLDIVPIARNVLVESMSDGVLVLDKDNHLADINPAAMQYLDIEEPAPIGQHIEIAMSKWPEILPRYIDAIEGHDEIMIHGTKPRFFDVRINPLSDSDGEYSGRLISFREITERKENEMELRRANQRLQLQLSEIEALQNKLKEQAIRDYLTGLYNRRYLQEHLENELRRAQRSSQPLSLVMMDLDHFKDCNDTYGHKAGDLVLKALAEMLTDRTRKQDIVCRYGGEEFLVVLPNTHLNVARERAEEWRGEFQNLVIEMGDLEIKTTLSAGLACYPLDGDTIEKLLQVADEALYKAKQEGRNQVFWL
jgi:diguanylate cyclase (GGDEF)-like protein